MKKHIKLLVLLLSLALVIGAVAVVAFASGESGNVAKIGENEYATLADALNAAEAGDTVILTQDASITDYYVTKNVVIDLNKKALSSEGKAFIFTQAVEFSIVGEGNIVIPGTLIDASTATADVKVSIAGTGLGIDILHTGEASPTLVNVMNGTYSFKNVYADVTTKGGNHTFTMANGAAAKYEFDHCTITSFNTNNRNDSLIVVNGAGSAVVKSTLIQTNACFARLRNSTSENPLVIENSKLFGMLRESDFIDQNEAGRKQIFLGHEADKSVAPIVVRNSYVEYSYRLNASENVNINFYGCTVRHNGYSNTHSSGDVLTTRMAAVYYDSDCVYLAAHSTNDLTWGDKQSATNRVYFAEGTRTNAKYLTTRADEKGIVFPDGSIPATSTTYKFVFDPAGNAEAPYVVKAISAEEGASVLTDAYFGDYVEYFNAEDLYSSNYNGVIYGDDGSYVASSGGSVRGDIFTKMAVWNLNYADLGTFLVHNNDGNTAIKYWINPVEGSTSSTRYIFKEAAGPDGKPQGKVPCFLFGNVTTETLANYKVLTYSIDFGTDSEAGFPLMSLELQSNARVSYFSINHEGKFTSIGLTGGDVSLSDITLSYNEWHRLNVIVYCESATAYFYLDGQYVGSALACKAGQTAITGLRFNVTGTNQAVGASMLFDNNVTCGYTEYKNSDSATNATPAYYIPKMSENNAQLITSINVHANTFETLNDALNYAAENDTVVSLSANVEEPQLVTANGLVKANGYTINVKDGSFGADSGYDENGNIAYYDFNEEYNSLKVKYYFYNSSKPFDYSTITENDFTVVEFGVGQTPAAPDTLVIAPRGVKDDVSGKYLLSNHIGWTKIAGSNTADELLPITVSFAKEYSEVYVYPVFSTNYVDPNHRWVILDKDGNYLRGGNKNNVWGSEMQKTFNLKYGETLVLTADLKIYAPISGARSGGEGEKVFGLDVNGFELLCSPLTAGGIRKESVWVVGNGETLNAYSSRPGGRVTGEGYNDVNKGKENQQTTGASGGVAFSFQPVALNHTESNQDTTNMNAHLNIGTFGGKYANNLTISAATAVAAQSGDKTCSITVDGATLIQNSNDYMGLVFARFYYGTLDIKNTTLIGASGSNTMIGGVGAAATVTDGVLTESTDCKITVDNCNILVTKNGAGIIATNQSCGSITFKNTYTNGSIKRHSSLKNNVYVDENCCAAAFVDVIFTEGVVAAMYNKDIKISDLPIVDSEMLSVPYIYTPKTAVGTIAVSNAIEYPTFIYASAGYNGEDANCILSTFVYKTVKAEDAVTVSFEGYGDVVYAKGGKVTADGIAYEDVVNKATKLVFTGKFDTELPTDIQESITVNPVYDVVSTVSGLKVNLSIYSDFDINLYIPASYDEYITSVTSGGKALEEKRVTIDGTEYIKVVVGKASDKAAEVAEFVINITEGEYSVSSAVTVDIATYASTILSDTAQTYTAADKQLMYYMVNYANEAYKYFGDGTANDTLASILTVYADAKGEGVAEQTYANAIADLKLGEVFESASIKLTSAPAFVLTVKEGFAGTVTVAYGDNVRTYTVKANNAREIVIDGMKVYNFGYTLTVNAEGAIGETAVKTEGAEYNLDTFVKYHVENTDNAESVACVALLKALYDYAACAAEYVK